VADARIELLDAMERPAEAESPPPRRAWAGWVLPAVVVVGPLIGALVGWVLAGRTEPPFPVSSRAPSAHLVLPLPKNAAVMPTPASAAVAISPDSRFVAYVAPASQQIGEETGLGAVSTSMLFLRPLDGGESRPIEGTAGGIAPFFSPDSRWLGFVDSNRGVLRKIPREGGVAIDLCDAQGDMRGAHWLEDGRIVFSQGGAGGIQEVSEDGGAPRTITTPDADAGEKTRRFGDPIPGSDAIVFMLGTTELSSYDDARIALFLPETGETRVLVDGGTSPRWVPTGHIVFARGGRLMAIRFDRRTLEVVGAPYPVLDDIVTSDGYGSAQYSFSDHGTLVYVRGGPDHYYFQLFTLGTDGRVELLPVPRDVYGDARVSPDGTRIVIGVLGANASLWTYDIARGTTTRLTEAWDNWSPVWSPDGHRIAFASNRNGTDGTWIMAADGTGDPELLGETGGMDGAPNSWSADGRLLSFSQGINGKAADIWTYAEDAGWTAKPLISSKYAEYQSAFSPDSRNVAYVSDESGQAEVYVQPVPTTGRKWKISTNGGGAPVWSPDGTKLYYWERGSLMVVPCRQEPEFAPGRATSLIEDVPIADVQFYDIFPDGERFLVVGRAGGAQDRSPIVTQSGHRRVFPAADPDLHVVTNWFAELER
jgi:serine/threonine-protein kinase